MYTQLKITGELDRAEFALHQYMGLRESFFFEF